jgi:hypothetical protein
LCKYIETLIKKSKKKQRKPQLFVEKHHKRRREGRGVVLVLVGAPPLLTYPSLFLVVYTERLIITNHSFDEKR